MFAEAFFLLDSSNFLRKFFEGERKLYLNDKKKKILFTTVDRSLKKLRPNE